MQVQSSRPIPGAVATAGVDERMAFVRRTYVHLAAAVFGFAMIAYLAVSSSYAEKMTMWAFSGYNWLVVLGTFMAVGWLADKWARSDTSQGIQYLGLALYVVAEAIILTPMLYIAKMYYPDAISVAGLATLVIFAGLTGTVFITKKDFSFMRGILGMMAMGALGLIVASMIFKFNLGLIFSFGMVVLAGGYILYYTSQVLAHYRPTQHVAASLALFSALALLFWYVLRIVMAVMGRD